MFHPLIEVVANKEKGVSLDDEVNHYLETTWVLNRSFSEKELGDFKFKISKLLKGHGLTVSSVGHDIRVCGKLSQFQKVLHLSLAKYTESDGVTTFVAPKENVEIPAEWKNHVVHIFGLSSERLAKKVSCIQLPAQDERDLKQKATLVPFTPLELAKLYNFPASDGTGQKVGIIELGGGYTQQDLVTYMRNLGLIDNTVSSFSNVVSVSVDGAKNNPSDPSGASVEVVLDLEIVLALVPKATINVYFAQNSDSSFYNAIAMAIRDSCSVISISWGLYESGWSSSSKTAYNNLFQSAVNAGVTIFCSAGDNGSSDGGVGNNVDFPASSPYAVACGGTTLVASGDKQSIVSETVWNNNPTSSATGGGLSTFFSQPSYQQGLSTGGKRGLPDVSAAADPNTGYILTYQGRQIVVGGTSAVSPLLSGLTARINQLRNVKTGFLQPTVYAANPSVCRDIVSGNNGAYSASSGWDSTSGLGVLDGTQLLNLLSGTSQDNPVPPPPPPPPTTPAPVANFSASITKGVSPLRTQFIDYSTNTPTSWLWDFGDKSQSNDKNPVKIYSNPGTYTVTLSVSNDGGSNVLVKQNYIKVTAPVILKAGFKASKTTGKAPLNVQFTDTSTGLPIKWSWTFSDGTTSSLRNPSKTFSKPGIITVTLTIQNALGDTSSFSNYINVTK